MSIQQILLGGSPSGYNLTRSLRFRASASAYLNRTPASAGNRQTWTWSSWVKRGAFGAGAIFQTYGPTGFGIQGSIEFPSDTIDFIFDYNAGSRWRLTTTAVYRDPSSWYHIVVVANTTSATSTDRLQIYVNGVRVTAFGTANYPTQNANGTLNQAYAHGIGARTDASAPFDGYMAEVNFIDGQALTPSSFGATNALTGVWQPAAYTGTYGTNGFYLKFTDNSALTTSSNVGLGKDFSGNGNYWTTNNISITAGVNYDSMTDVPTLTNPTTANYAVFNPIVAPAFLQGAVITLGNLRVGGTNGVSNTFARSTMGISGKMYAEFFFDVVSSTASIGVAPVNDTASTGNLAAQSTNICYRSGGNKRVLGTETAYGASWAANNIIGVAVDTTANTVEFFKNGASQGVITSSAFFAQGACLFAISTDDVGSPAGFANFGQRPFTYTPPTGFVALNTFNLPAATIVKGNTVMDATTYTGTGAAQNVTNTASFKPDFVWTKSRSIAASHILVDSVRGASQEISSNDTTAETTNSNRITSFNSNGWSLGSTTAASLNQSSATYVGWQWQAGQGSTSSNTNGSITSTVSVNPTSGFSVVTYTGTGANATVGHGLGVAPSFIIVRNRNGGDGKVYTRMTGNTTQGFLNDTAAFQGSSPTLWNSTSPTSTVFSIGTNAGVNQSTAPIVAYCWSEIDGYSKFGSYTGNGSTDGPFVFCGFRPRWLLIRSTTAGRDWLLYDTARLAYNVGPEGPLQPNTSGTPYNNAGYINGVDILSNGFKLRVATTNLNASGETMIYAAFAENPFKNALAR